MTTYKEAADNAFDRLIFLTGDGTIYKPPNNGFWHQGNALSTCVEYLAKSSRGDNETIIQNAVNVFDCLTKDYCPDCLPAWTSIGRYTNKGYWLDDYGWWGLALRRAYDYSEKLKLSPALTALLLKYSKTCWSVLHGGWDDTSIYAGSDISGGAWNHECPDGQLSGRNSITNENLWILSERLRDGGQQYIDQENTSATWFADAIDKNALFDTRNLVLERLVNMNWFQQNWVWAGDQGMFILACVIHSFYVSPGSNFLPWANRVSQAVQDNLLDGDKVLHDPPLPDLYCGFSVDYATGKGVLLRCLSEWAEIGSDVKPPDYLSEFILNNAAHVWNNRLYKNDTNPSDPTKKYQFGFNWNPSGKPPFAPEPPFPSGSNGSLFSQLVLQVSGMAALNAALNFAPNDEIPGS